MVSCRIWPTSQGSLSLVDAVRSHEALRVTSYAVLVKRDLLIQAILVV